MLKWELREGGIFNELNLHFVTVVRNSNCRILKGIVEELVGLFPLFRFLDFFTNKTEENKTTIDG